MTSKVIEGHKRSSNFSVNPTLPLLDALMLPPSNCVDLYLFLFLSPEVPLLLFLMPIYGRFQFYGRLYTALHTKGCVSCKS